MELSDFKPGDKVRYVPNHAHGDLSHQDVERGEVSSVSSRYVFVRYYRPHGMTGPQATDASDLVKG